jgi:hypothetical protein
VNVDDIGCSVLTATGRKWLRGPRGTGLLYVRQSTFADLEPPFLDVHAARWVSDTGIAVRKDARRFESWEHSVANRLGLGAAVDYALALGIDDIAAHVTELASSARSMLAEIPGLALHDLGVERCGIVTFTVDGVDPYALAARLRAVQINISVSTIDFARFDELARRAAGPGTPGMDARRADAFVDLVRGAEPGRVAVQIRVVVPHTTLLGLDDRPGELAGYGPVPAEVARRLAADATWRRILSDPRSGAVLEVGGTRYRPPAHLAELVVTRDRTCRHPGCRVPAQRCDLDHTRPFDATTGAGPTIAANLAASCRAHHRLKHQPGWRVLQQPDATIIWTPPSGHTYPTRPPPLC